MIVEGDVLAACDSVAAPWSGIAGASLERAHMLIDAAELLPDVFGDSLVEAGAGAPLPGCVVTGFHPAGLGDGARARLFLPAPGWGTLWRIAADGPDGQVLTYQRGRVRCQVSDAWDGGDDSDSTYVPDPFFREVVLCWRHGRELVAGDTAVAS